MAVVENLFVVLTFCAFVGIFPFYDSNTRRFTSKKLYCAILMVATATIHLYTIIMTTILKLEKQIHLIDFTYVTQITWGIFVVCIIFITMIWQMPQVNLLFGHVYLIDECLMTVHSVVPKEVSNVKFKTLTANILMAGLLVFLGRAFILNGQSGFSVAIKVIQVYYLLNLSIMEFFILKSAELRLAAIHVAMQNLSNKDVQANFYEDVVRKVKSLMKVHWTSCELLYTYNDLFGWHTFLQIIMTCINLLMLIYHIVSHHSLTFASTFPMVCFNIYLIVQLLTYVKISENLKKKLDCIMRTADHLLQTFIEYQKLSKYFLVLSQQAKVKQPQISAAGFFLVDYQMIFTFVNIFAAYVVIIFQYR